MSDGVVALHGGPTYQRKVVDGVVETLEDLLERARSGEIICLTAVYTYYDGLAAYTSSGLVGGYSQLGALRMAENSLISIMVE